MHFVYQDDGRSMCGISAYIGKKDNAPEIVFEGLKKLEYRGYDSWGIAVKGKGKIKLQKAIGEIGNSKLKIKNSSVAIGHTRWATHGGVTVANAHPHLDCSGNIALVHNGIVENYQELKKDLLERGHKFKSETDTELIPHLIEENLKKNNFVEAVRLSFNQLSGMNAVVVLNGQEGKIVACKNGSPLVVGIGQQENYLASDVTAFIEFTNQVYFLEDYDLIVVSKDNIELFVAESGRVKPFKITELTWQFEKTTLGQYEHYMLKEIFEQPEIVYNLSLDNQEIKKIAQLIEKAYGTFLIACGSASYSCLAGVYLFSKFAKKHVNFAIGSEFNYIEDYLTPKSLLIAVSQSGETMDVMEPVTQAKKRQANIVSVTNTLGSSLYRVGGYRFLLQAGVEKAVCSTKALTAMFAVMILLSFAVAGKLKQAQEILQKSSQEIKKILGKKEEIKDLAHMIYKNKHIFVLGRGLSYPVALEATLKIKESSYIHAEGFAGGELKHGVIALIEKGTPVIVFAPNDETYDAIISNAMEVKARGAFVIGVGYQNNQAFDYFFEIKDVGASSILPHNVFAQLLGYYMSTKQGINPDRPRNLAKSVTVK